MSFFLEIDHLIEALKMRTFVHFCNFLLHHCVHIIFKVLNFFHVLLKYFVKLFTLYYFRPMEITSKKPVSRFKQVIPVKKKVC